MKNKNVFISGSSRGIGLAIAEKFGLMGANVIINCNKSIDELAEAKKRLSAMGVSVYAYAGDVSDYEDCRIVIDSAVRAVGEIDILVNNAGISHIGLFTELSPIDMRRLTETNQYSVYNCCHLVVPSMIRRKEGRIINISSIWGISGASCEVVYSASKGWVNTFTKALAKETAPSNVLVNAIACGVIDTDMNSWLSTDERDELKNSIGLMRFGTTGDIAGLCAYLAQTSYMTGQVLCMDGGLI